MSFSRRRFLKTVGATVAVGSVPASIPAISQALRFEPVRAPRQARAILLDSNENAYGPSKQVKGRLLDVVASCNRYPVSSDVLAARIASMHHVPRERVLAGCGSTEMIRVLAAALLGPGKAVITASPTFEAISEYARVYGAQAVAVPLNHEFSHDLDAMLARVDGSTALIYICNPNNPTGSITPRRAIEQFLTKLSASAIVVVDEAYHHFVGRSYTYTSFLDQPVADDRMVVLRTFSKVYGLAGLRIGYAVASPTLVARLKRNVTDMGVSELGLQAALAAMDDEEGLGLAVKRNADDRQEFFNQATARMLKPIDSKTNFVMMDVHHPATEVIEHFRKNNVLIGPPFPPMNHHIRVSLGTPQNMEQFWRVWDLLPYAHGMKM
jgi:histidinol-phosphate aminotransferase